MVAPLRSQVRLRLSRLSVQHGRSASSHRPALTLARCSVAAHCALLRVLATPALRASDVRKLTRGAPCFTGLIDGYCSHWLRRLFRPHWAYFALLRAQRARFVRPLGLKGSLLDSATTAGSCPAKSLLFPEGKRGARRPPPVAETGRSRRSPEGVEGRGQREALRSPGIPGQRSAGRYEDPSETGNIASALCARSEATMLNCGTVARRKPRRRDRQIQSLIYFRAKVRQFPLAFPQKIW